MPVRVAYVVSGFPVAWIATEAESHRQAGWTVLPLSSSRPVTHPLSAMESQWRDRTIYRPSVLVMLLAMMREAFRHPIRMAKLAGWSLGMWRKDRGEAAKACYEFLVAPYFAQRCRKAGIQHVHVHFASRSLSLGVMLQVLLDQPSLSCTVHAFDIFTRSRGALRDRLLACDFVVAISQFNIEYLRELCGDDVAARCRLVRLGVDLSQFSADGRKPVPGRLISISNLVSKKGLDVTIRACGLLRDMGVQFEYQIVGGGPLRDQLSRRIAALGLDDRVKLLGSMPNDKLRPLLLEAAALVMPCVIVAGGDRDGIPVAMMEAMACQVPVISTWVSGLPELVKDGVNGWLVHERDPQALAAKMKEVLGAPALVERFGLAARRHVEENFNLATNTTVLRGLMRQAVEAHQGSR